MGEGVARVVQRGVAMKLCKDCKHHRSGVPGYEHFPSECWAPQAPRSMEFGDPYMRPLELRGDEAQCGAAAAWFEPSPPELWHRPEPPPSVVRYESGGLVGVQKRKWWRLWA
jgi:hypothetical protein